MQNVFIIMYTTVNMYNTIMKFYNVKCIICIFLIKI